MTQRFKQTFKLTIEYDGTGLFGWQRQKDQTTVQGELEKVLSLILNQEILIHGSGRTDAGVHAVGQVAHFTAPTNLTPEKIQKAVNSLMRHPIVIHDCVRVPETFHSQYQAKSKTYRYFIVNRPVPCAVDRNYRWHVREPLDMDAMNNCSERLLGIHDFKAFENTGSPRSSTVREVHRAMWTKEQNNLLVFEIAATGFLKNMVRNIVGTLKEVGCHKMDAKAFSQILDSQDRSLAGATAPAKGLFLYKVDYSQ